MLQPSQLKLRQLCWRSGDALIEQYDAGAEEERRTQHQQQDFDQQHCDQAMAIGLP